MTHKKPEDFNPAKLKRLEQAQKMMQKIKKQEKAIIDSDKWSISDKEDSCYEQFVKFIFS